jgi:LPXTG-motif cell wall-anchored protein
MRYWTKVRAGVAALVISLTGIGIAAAQAAPADAATTRNVSIVGLSFSPRTLTVQPGDTVVWTNNSGLAHTVTADNGSFDSGSLSPGQTFSHTFSSAGTVPYHCSFHGAAGGIGMSGTIVVQAAPPPTTAPPVTAPATAPPTSAPAAPGVAPVPAAPSTTAPPSGSAPGTPSASVAGVTATADAPHLAHTGANTAGLAWLAAALLLTGGLAAVAARRRSHLRRPA